MDLVHQDLEASVHDLMDFLGIELAGDGGVVGHVREENGDGLSLALDRASSGKDLIGEVLRSVGVGGRVVYRGGFFGLAKIVTALVAEGAL
jgi:hypothetical protein